MSHFRERLFRWDTLVACATSENAVARQLQPHTEGCPCSAIQDKAADYLCPAFAGCRAERAPVLGSHLFREVATAATYFDSHGTEEDARPQDSPNPPPARPARRSHSERCAPVVPATIAPTTAAATGPRSAATDGRKDSDCHPLTVIELQFGLQGLLNRFFFKNPVPVQKPSTSRCHHRARA
jgi:hypothetical protein